MSAADTALPRALPLSGDARRRLRALTWLVLAVTLFTAVIASTAVVRSWQNAIQREEKFLRGTTAALAATIDRRLEAVDVTLGLVVQQLAAGHGDVLIGLADLASTLRDANAGNRAIASMGVVDVSGRLIASTSNAIETAAVEGMTARARAHHARSGGGGLFVGPGAERSGLEPIVFVVSRALRDGDSNLLGIVFATIPIDDLVSTVAETINRDGGRVTIMNGEYIVIARLPRASLGADLSKTPISRVVQTAGPNGTLRARSTIDGQELLSSYASSLVFPFHVVMSKDLPSISARWLDEESLELVLLAVLFLGTLLLNVALHRRMRGQLVAEQALLTSEQKRYQHGLEGARDGLAIWDRNGALVTWNRRFDELAALVGVDPVAQGTFAQLIDRVAEEVVPERHADARLEWRAQRALAFDRADGTPTEIGLPGALVLEIAHQRAGNDDVVTTLRDVSGERAAQRRIESSEARFRDGIESMGEGFVLWDRDDRLVAWNQRVLEMLPLQAPLMHVGTRFDDILAHLERLAPQQPHPESWLAHLAARRERRGRLGTSSIFHSGHSRIIETVDRATSDGGIVSIFRDITDQRALLDRLRTHEQELVRSLVAEREMNEQQRRFVAMASHEFRTPLAVIDSASQRLLTRPMVASDIAVQRRLERIRTSVSRMTEIIDRTLTTARLDEGRIEFAPACFDLAELAREVIKRQLSIAPDFEIRTEIPEGGLVIDGDRRLIDHALTNLVSNAVKYSTTVKVVDIGMDSTAEGVVITVTDRGVGIPEHEIERLFTRFFRASNARGIAGTGIGLNLVREFVAMHGGRTDVRSAVGIGSTFTIHLPRTRLQSTAA